MVLHTPAFPLLYLSPIFLASRTRMYRAIEEGGGGDQHPQVRHEFRRKTNRILSAQKGIFCCRRCFPPSLWRAFCCVLCFVSCACLFVIADDDDLIIILHILYDDVFSFFFWLLIHPLLVTVCRKIVSFLRITLLLQNGQNFFTKAW